MTPNYDSSRLDAWTFGVTLDGKECGTFGSERKHGPLAAAVEGFFRGGLVVGRAGIICRIIRGAQGVSRGLRTPRPPLLRTWV